jgi:hypothetical protein
VGRSPLGAGTAACCREAGTCTRRGCSGSTAGFRAYAATLLRRIDLGSVRADSYGFQIEMTYRAIRGGGRVREVPIRFVDRVAGTSKMSFYTVVEALVLVTWWGARRVVGAGQAVIGRRPTVAGRR